MILNLNNAEIACELIQLAYARFDDSIDLSGGIVISTANFVTKHKFIAELFVRPDYPFLPRESFGFISESDTAIWIAMRGTDTFLDWITDARLELVDTELPYGQVTAGIDDLAWQLRDQIVSASLADKKTIICGHSLGAAVATRAAPLLRRADEIYPIASPLFADHSYAENYRLQYGYQTYRIVNTVDEVPKVPGDIPGLLELHHTCPALEFTAEMGSLTKNHAISTYKNNLWRLQ